MIQIVLSIFLVLGLMTPSQLLAEETQVVLAHDELHKLMDELEEKFDSLRGNFRNAAKLEQNLLSSQRMGEIAVQSLNHIPDAVKGQPITASQKAVFKGYMGELLTISAQVELAFLENRTSDIVDLLKEVVRLRDEAHDVFQDK